MCLDHGLKDVTNRDWVTLPSKVVRNGEDGTQVIKGVTPFSCEETIIEVEPTDLCPDIECTPDRVKLVVGSRDASSYNNRAFNGMSCK